MAVLIGLLGICGAIVVHMIASELYHQTPRWAALILKRAARFLPEEAQSRYLEEWTSHLEQQIGALAQLRHAVECWLVSRSLSRVLAAAPITATPEIKITVTAPTAQFLRYVLPHLSQKNRDLDGLQAAVKQLWDSGSLPRPDPSELRLLVSAIDRLATKADWANVKMVVRGKEHVD
jgi:hypothetical protein